MYDYVAEAKQMLGYLKLKSLSIRRNPIDLPFNTVCPVGLGVQVNQQRVVDD
jgi:hypothetical protein